MWWSVLRFLALGMMVQSGHGSRRSGRGSRRSGHVQIHAATEAVCLEIMRKHAVSGTREWEERSHTWPDPHGLDDEVYMMGDANANAKIFQELLDFDSRWLADARNVMIASWSPDLEAVRYLRQNDGQYSGALNEMQKPDYAVVPTIHEKKAFAKELMAFPKIGHRKRVEVYKRWVMDAYSPGDCVDVSLPDPPKKYIESSLRSFKLNVQNGIASNIAGKKAKYLKAGSTAKLHVSLGCTNWEESSIWGGMTAEQKEDLAWFVYERTVDAYAEHFDENKDRVYVYLVMPKGVTTAMMTDPDDELRRQSAHHIRMIRPLSWR